nr:MAG TPA: Minor capsid protein from bacteriophage [Caudoviricetes sp.]
MSRTSGVVDWLSACPFLDKIEAIDVNQLSPDLEALGVYKQPTRTVTELIDGSAIINEIYYLLFRQPAQLAQERLSSEEYLEKVEGWIEDQNWVENFPQIGSAVHDVEVVNTFYMMDRDDDEAVYQLSIAITYERKSK